MNYNLQSSLEVEEWILKGLQKLQPIVKEQLDKADALGVATPGLRDDCTRIEQMLKWSEEHAGSGKSPGNGGLSIESLEIIRAAIEMAARSDEEIQAKHRDLAEETLNALQGRVAKRRRYLAEQTFSDGRSGAQKLASWGQ